MTVKWRQHELLMICTFAVFVFVRFFINGFSSHLIFDSVSGEQKPIPTVIYFLHTLLPKAAPIIAVFSIYLLVNLWLIPTANKKNYKLYYAIVAAIVIWMFLSVCFALSYYYEWIYSGITYELTSIKTKAPSYGVSIAGVITITYSLYLLIRENTIKYLERDTSRTGLRILLCNKITTTVVAYFLCLALPLVFGMGITQGISYLFIMVLLPSIVLVFINVYWLGPRHLKKQFKLKQVIPYLIIIPMVIIFTVTFILSLLTHRVSANYSIPVFLFLVLVVNPISWLIFKQQRSQITDMQQLRSDLGKSTANLQFLRSQINPHFLFNALNTIYGTALLENAPRAAEAAQKLGDMMRFMLQENHQDFISLQREIEYLSNYIDLQSLRIADSPMITIESNIENRPQTLMIAPMLLIPFIENSFKHGISLREKSWIRINLETKDELIRFDITNSMHQRNSQDTEKFNHGIGLENVKQRLAMLYPGKHELMVRQNNNEFYVHLSINTSTDIYKFNY